ncbi:hypothetical protein MCOR27_008996 [Pyricularia oryzae]|uniref:HTH APSES-type domain-containing protein n=2 Tax=Pyricularia TaxID=48558 RepID=A0ABQ8N8N9_PYRGI|nr:hypothetical protein MCOR01_008329 [Pyricularia oryzae]KAI6292669.1 hypothetical protein MCOR33_009696 [Pyricularia grisea]KAH9438937.1 hypothetical protein MCOR02_002528 [Pyricularia oryzae]KAI6254548.1 hypothetical protein MCOR19_008955 [Pyricularia oryzae]KAI6271087.1 hypothetical protein MCOR27_008996 [Pyricularia oryzae]
MSITREHSLPARRNPYMVEDVPDYADLVNCRALGQTKLTQRVAIPKDAESNGLRVFDYAHLRAPLPKGVVSGIFSKGTPNAYFLMRRSSDGYVSATGMFKATFPYADAEDEEAERNYIKSLPATSKEETAGNVWISPDQALALAEEYSIATWIRALLDPTDIPLHGPQSARAAAASSKVISAPPKYFHGVAPPTPSSIRTSSRTRRSASPTKSSRATASPRKRSSKALSSQQSAPSETSSAKPSASPTLATSQLGAAPALPVPVPVPALEPVAEDVVIESLEKEEPAPVPMEEDEPKVKITVDQDVKIDENGVETTHTNMEVELPLFGEPPSAEETARMVAEAKEMVLAAKETVSGSASVPGSPSVTRQPETSVKTSKRKAEGISVDEQEEAEKDKEDRVVENGPRAKKMKTEAEQKRDRVRKRALFGISATLAVGAASALVPYVMGML